MTKLRTMRPAQNDLPSVPGSVTPNSVAVPHSITIHFRGERALVTFAPGHGFDLYSRMPSKPFGTPLKWLRSFPESVLAYHLQEWIDSVESGFVCAG